MKNKDDLILEQLYQEGILDRIGGQFKGVKAGSGQLLQNLSRKIYQKAGGEAMPPASQTAGQSYAKAQQKSLLDSFIKKTGKEIEDFKKDLLAMGVSGDPEEIKKTHPSIAQRIKQVESLLNYLNNPAATPAAATPAAIPNESKITDKSGTTYEYDATENKWYIRSKSGNSLSPVPNDNDVMQKHITDAWNKKPTPAATPAATPAVPSIWLNTQQARDFLNINNKDLWNLVASKKLRAEKRPNGLYRFSRQSLDRYKKNLTMPESYNVFSQFLEKYNLL